MTPSDLQIRQMLETAAREGVGWVYRHGYHWYWQTFRPALEEEARKDVLDQSTLADCYYVCGDVHDLNGAPRAAIQEYLKVLDIEPDLAAAYRELANMHHQLGDYEEAQRYSDKSLLLDPEDEHTIGERKEIEDSILHNQPPLYMPGPVLDAREHLAAACPQEALKELEGCPGRKAAFTRANCYGAMDQKEDYLRERQKCLEHSSTLEFSPADWFFVSEAVYNAPELWQRMLDANVRYEGFCVFFESQEKSPRFRELSEDEKIRVTLQYLAKSGAKDLEGLETLLLEFPDWVELRETIQEMKEAPHKR